MATLAQILEKKYPGRQWRLVGDDYATLEFLDVGVVPTEVEIRAFSAEVDGLIADETLKRRQVQLILSDPGRLFLALDILADAVNELAAGGLTPATQTKINALRNRLDAIRGG